MESNADRWLNYKERLERLFLDLTRKEMTWQAIGFKCFAVRRPTNLGNYREADKGDLHFLRKNFCLSRWGGLAPIVEFMMTARHSREHAATALATARTGLLNQEEMGEILNVALRNIIRLETELGMIEHFFDEFERLDQYIWWETMAQSGGRPHTQADRLSFLRTWMLQIPEIQYQVNELGWSEEEAIKTMLEAEVLEVELALRSVTPQDEDANNATGEGEVCDEDQYDEDAAELDAHNDETFNVDEAIAGFVQQFDRHAIPFNPQFTNHAAFRQNLSTSRSANGDEQPATRVNIPESDGTPGA